MIANLGMLIMEFVQTAALLLILKSLQKLNKS